MPNFTFLWRLKTSTATTKMPVDAQSHRLSTGKFFNTLFAIFDRKCHRIIPAGVLLLPRGGGSMERHYLHITTDCDVLASKTVAYEYASSPSGVRQRFGVPTAVSVVFMVSYLLACGDIEPNPGPGSDDRPGTSDQDNVILKALDTAVKRLEDKHDNSTARLERNMTEMRDSLLTHLHKVESKVSELETQCSDLQQENRELNKKLDSLTMKCDSLENHSRRNNLLFFGVERGRGFESWEECEAKVRKVIKDGIGISDEICIERAHRVGREQAVIVKFASYKTKSMIINNSRKLKDSDRYKDVYVREDFSAAVRMKRKGLREKAKQLFSAGQKSKLRFDRLITNSAVYTYSLEREEVVKVSDRGGGSRGMGADGERMGEEEREGLGAGAGARHDLMSWDEDGKGRGGRSRSRQEWERERGNVLDGAMGGGQDVDMRSQGRRLSDDWDYDPFGFTTDFPPLTRPQRTASDDDISNSQVSENRNRNQTGNSGTSEEASRDARRLSSIPRRVRSPVNTRLRSVSSRPTSSDDNTQPRINTALQGMQHNSNNAVRGGGGRRRGGSTTSNR